MRAVMLALLLAAAVAASPPISQEQNRLIGVPLAELDASCAYYASDAYNARSTFLAGWAHELHVAFASDELQADGFESDLFDFVVAVRAPEESSRAWIHAHTQLVADAGVPADLQWRRTKKGLIDNPLVAQPSEAEQRAHKASLETLIGRHNEARKRVQDGNEQRALTEEERGDVPLAVRDRNAVDARLWELAERLVGGRNKMESKGTLGETVRAQCKQGHRVTFTGHSNGGAVAALLAWYFHSKAPGCDLNVVTFGAPRFLSAAAANSLRTLEPPIATRRYVTQCGGELQPVTDVMTRVRPLLVHAHDPLIVAGNDNVHDANTYALHHPELAAAKQALARAEGLKEDLPYPLWRSEVDKHAHRVASLELQARPALGVLCHFPDNYFDAMQRALRLQHGYDLRWCTAQGYTVIPGAAIVDRWQSFRSRHINAPHTWPASESYKEWARIVNDRHSDGSCPRHTPRYRHRSKFIRAPPPRVTAETAPLQQPPEWVGRAEEGANGTVSGSAEARANEGSEDSYIDDFRTYDPKFLPRPPAPKRHKPRPRVAPEPPAPEEEAAPAEASRPAKSERPDPDAAF